MIIAKDCKGCQETQTTKHNILYKYISSIKHDYNSVFISFVFSSSR